MAKNQKKEKVQFPLIFDDTKRKKEEEKGISTLGTSMCFLGTNSAMPSAHRNVSATAIRFCDSASWFLVDVGEATQHQILHNSVVSLGDVKVILITHLHGDHCWGLPGLLASRSLLAKGSSSVEEEQEQRSSSPSPSPSPSSPSSPSSTPSELHTSLPGGEKLIIVGPKGVRNLCSVLYHLSETYLKLGVEWIELEENKIHNLGELQGGISVTAYPLTHPVPTFGYVFQEPEKRGKFNAVKAKELKVPPKLFSKLTGDTKKGIPPTSITLENGNVIQPEEVMGAPIPGRKFVILGDTSNSDELIGKVENCTAIVHEATFDESREEEAIAKGHSTSKMAAHFAVKVDAEVLLLNHFSSRYSPEETQEFAKEASKYFNGKSEYSSKPRNVIVTHDHMAVSFGFNNG